jgi:hypothetical protein
VDTPSISLIVFVFIVLGTLLGTFCRSLVPEHHLNSDSKDVIKMSTGLIATMSALVLGLLIATAKTSFDGKATQVRQIAANVVLLDQVLAQYGEEATTIRRQLRQGLDLMADRIWHENNSASKNSSPFQATGAAESFMQDLFKLSATTDFQRALKAEIVRLANDIAKERLSLYVERGDTVSMPFLTILAFWLTVIFGVFGLLTRLNILVGLILLLCAISVSASIFLILDLNSPFDGLMRIPSAQLRNAVPPLNP